MSTRGEKVVAKFVMEELVEDAVRTEPDLTGYIDARKRTSPHNTMRLLHAAMGMCTEAGEFADQIKKHVFYGKTLDRTNLIEEAGDALWYIRIACDAMNVPFSEVLERNVAKLKARFPDKFTEENAQVRDLVKERVILESESETIPTNPRCHAVTQGRQCQLREGHSGGHQSVFQDPTKRHYFVHSAENIRLTTACKVCGFIERHPIHDMTV